MWKMEIKRKDALMGSRRLHCSETSPFLLFDFKQAIPGGIHSPFYPEA